MLRSPRQLPTDVLLTIQKFSVDALAAETLELVTRSAVTSMKKTLI